MRLNAKQLRVTKPTDGELASVERNPIYIVLDNVLDTYNIGSLFRLADAVAARELILCGETERPPSSRIHKAAVGTETWVPWRYEPDAPAALANLKSQIPNLKIIAVEQDKGAVPYNSPLLPSLNLRGGSEEVISVAIVVGHETEGVSRLALEMADVIVEIPMYGVNRSLNVHIAAAIVIYRLVG